MSTLSSFIEQLSRLLAEGSDHSWLWLFPVHQILVTLDNQNRTTSSPTETTPSQSSEPALDDLNALKQPSMTPEQEQYAKAREDLDTSLYARDVEISKAQNTLSELQQKRDAAWFPSSYDKQIETTQTTLDAQQERKELFQDAKERADKLAAEGKYSEANAVIESAFTDSVEVYKQKQRAQDEARQAALQAERTILNATDTAIGAAYETTAVVKSGTVVVATLAAGPQGGAAVAALNNLAGQGAEMAINGKSFGDAAKDAGIGMVKDGILVGATATGVGGATLIGEAGLGVGMTTVGLMGTGAGVAATSEAANIAVDTMTGTHEFDLKTDAASVALAGLGGALGGGVGIGGNVMREGAKTLTGKAVALTTEAAADITVAAGEELARAKLNGEDITAAGYRDALFHAVEGTITGETGSHVRNHHIGRQSSAHAESSSTNALSTDQPPHETSAKISNEEQLTAAHDSSSATHDFESTTESGSPGATSTAAATQEELSTTPAQSPTDNPVFTAEEHTTTSAPEVPPAPGTELPPSPATETNNAVLDDASLTATSTAGDMRLSASQAEKRFAYYASQNEGNTAYREADGSYTMELASGESIHITRGADGNLVETQTTPGQPPIVRQGKDSFESVAAKLDQLPELKSRSDVTRNTPSNQRRHLEETDPVGAVARSQIGDIGKIIEREDIVQTSRQDEIVSTQTNFLHGSLDAVEQLTNNALSGERATLGYIEAKGLTAVNNAGAHESGDRLIEIANTAVREHFQQLDPDAVVFRGPNAAIIVQSNKLTPEDLVRSQPDLEQVIQEKVASDPVLSQVEGAHRVRLGSTEVPPMEVPSSLPPEQRTIDGALEHPDFREQAKEHYYRALSEAAAAAEFDKNTLNDGSPAHTFEQMRMKGGYESAEAAVVANFNFIPPEASAGSFYDMRDQQRRVYAAMDKLVEPSMKPDGTLDREAQRVEVAKLLQQGPQTPEQATQHSEARQALVTYEAMMQRPARFEGNAADVHAGKAVPLLNLRASDNYERGLIEAGHPYMRADGDFDFLRDGFGADRRDLASGELTLDTVYQSADDRIGRFFNESAQSLRTLETQVNAELAAQGKAPVRFFMGKQSTSDEYRLIAAGENVTPEIMDRAMNTVRDTVKQIGEERPFPIVHKVTGVEISPSGCTTTTMGTDYEFIRTEAQREHVGAYNDEIVNLRKFIPEKNSSGSLDNLTPEQAQGIGKTFGDYMDFAEGILSRHANGEDIPIQQIEKANNALNDVRLAIAHYATPGADGPNCHGDVLRPKGLNVDSINERLTALEDRFRFDQKTNSQSETNFSSRVAASVVADRPDEVEASSSVSSAPERPRLRPPAMANTGIDPFGTMAGMFDRFRGNAGSRPEAELRPTTPPSEPNQQYANVNPDDLRVIYQESPNLGEAMILRAEDIPRAQPAPTPDWDRAAMAGNAVIIPKEYAPSPVAPLNPRPDFWQHEMVNRSPGMQAVEVQLRGLPDYALATIGRSPGSDIVIYDTTISRHVHAAVKKLPNNSYELFSNAASGSGTYVNGVKIQEQTPLRPGDTIKIGAQEYRVPALDANPAQLAGLEAEFANLKPGESKIVGRNAQIDTGSDDRSVSRIHATITRSADGSLFINDGTPSPSNMVQYQLPGTTTWITLDATGKATLPANSRIKLGEQELVLPPTVITPRNVPGVAPDADDAVIGNFGRTMNHVGRVQGNADYSAPSDTSPLGRLNGFRIIGHDQQIQNGVYIGGGNRPAIVVDVPGDPVLQRAIQGAYEDRGVRRALGAGTVSEDQLITATAQYVDRTMRYDLNADQRVMNQYAAMRDELVPLGAYVEAGTGVCAHKSLYLGTVLEQMKADGLIQGDISMDRNSQTGIGAHAWIRYTKPDGQVWILDPTQHYYGPLADSKRNAQWAYYRPSDAR